MGMFDYYRVSHPAFTCSEGHDLGDEEFQGKDGDCTMAEHEIGDVLTLGEGVFGGTEERPRFTSTVDVYCDCTRCPAFVQARTHNLVATGVEFAVTIEGETCRVLRVERTSPSTADFLRDEPAREYMRGCLGPMPYDEAQRIHREGLGQARRTAGVIAGLEEELPDSIAATAPRKGGS